MVSLWKKTRKNPRKGPSESATDFPEGTIKFGNDKQRWVVVKNIKNIQRWAPLASTTLFGYTPLTVNYLAENIGKPITVYERQMIGKWPTKRGDFDVKYTFTPSGDLAREESGRDRSKDVVYKNWLKTRKPPVDSEAWYLILGSMHGDLGEDTALKVSPKPDEVVSSNLNNTDAFVKSND